MTHHTDKTSPPVVSRRNVLAGVAGLAAVAGLPTPLSAHDRADESVLDSYRIMFDEARKLGQRVNGAYLIPTLAAQAQALRTLARDAQPQTRNASLVLAARFAEYAGWMAQEIGNDSLAAWWTDRAVQLARDGADDEMASFALVRLALITLYRRDAVQTVALSRRAQTAPCSRRTHGLAAQREAQGHAIAGDYDACLRALDRAAALLDAPSERSTGPILGTSNVIDPVAAATGWCLYDLDRPAQAAEILRRELDRIPGQALRARSRYGARLALALAGSGELEAACAAAEPIVSTYDVVGSATIRVDLRELARSLNRWPTHPDVRDLLPRLSAALRTHEKSL